MIPFRTTLSIPKSFFEIGYNTPIVMLGSCFTENIGAKLRDLKIPININPFGITYNPISIAHTVNYLMTNSPFPESNIFQNGDLWHSGYHHGRFSHIQKEEILRGIQSELDLARLHFKKSNRMVLTLGTAHVFVEKKSNLIVNNCHKVPPQYFDKKRLSVGNIVENLVPIFGKIFSQNPDYQIIVTVSPIRHLRDGLIENNRSKATLLLACDELTKQFSNITYFPAYELLIDDLRDYRFFAPDMMHPTEQAIDYIWAHFKVTFFSEYTQNVMEEVQKVNTMQAHRPMFPNTEGYQNFVKNLEKRVVVLKEKYPFLYKNE